ncbi:MULTISPECIES: ComEA family DNA-binding protein [Pseudomonas]|uniref:ComEA family DNA-binding protein n=1 Tax=Pseudomonas TaxID=286 RepID=UPI00059CDFCC|nr:MULTISPECIES: helix-hairpin-helix domain-containing protein [Pseudomonas]AMT90138.1 competence protein ComEA [Pseudomonas koreensis]MBB4057291.1 competence protein ComEA [Pseudomonas koreensis]TSB50249.1 helix-hairpin-helix domain-containing protein [Pseudomonas sp. ef1]
MRTGYFYSLIFAFLTSASIAAIAAPFAPTESAKAPMVMDAAAPLQGAKVDLNGADAATLQKELAGVGEAKAKAIVAYRETNGPFASVDELLEVKGIGKAILDRNRDKLEVN